MKPTAIGQFENVRLNRPATAADGGRGGGGGDSSRAPPSHEFGSSYVGVLVVWVGIFTE